jgi:hypothetical protein
MEDNTKSENTNLEEITETKTIETAEVVIDDATPDEVNQINELDSEKVTNEVLESETSEEITISLNKSELKKLKKIGKEIKAKAKKAKQKKQEKIKKAKKKKKARAKKEKIRTKLKEKKAKKKATNRKKKSKKK